MACTQGTAVFPEVRAMTFDQCHSRVPHTSSARLIDGVRGEPARGRRAGARRIGQPNYFTQDAIEFASGRNLRLIAGPELREMIRILRLTGAPPPRQSPRWKALRATVDGCGTSMPRVAEEARATLSGPR